MGLGPSWAKSSSIYDKYQEAKDNRYKDQVPPNTITEYVKGNPDPSQFRIDRHEELGEYLILLVVYRGVTNYEGKKVLVYKDLTYKQVLTFRTLDPHFSANKDYHSPIARFEPTMIGWAHAKRFCNCLIN